jgi:hypothetical protein
MKKILRHIWNTLFRNRITSMFHCEDGPFMEFEDGSNVWCIYGKVVYSNNKNNLHKYPYLSKKFKQSIIKYELNK